jgi:type I restriction enzyme S subunit
VSWPSVKLGDIVENCSSKRIPLKQADRAERNGDYRYYGASGVIDYVDDYLFDGDYLLIGEDGNNLISRSTPIAFHASGKFWVNNHAHVLTSSGKADLGFISYYINSINLEPYITGSAQPKLNKSNLEAIKIPLPPLVEQKRIAEILDKADAIRRKRQQTIQLADDFLRSVFQDMFGDPVSNPKGWDLKPIKELAKVTTGNTPARKVPEYFGGEMEWIKSDNINTPYHILTTAKEYLSVEGINVSRTVPKGSTLITCIAGSFDCIGNAAYTDREVAFNQQINALTPKESVLSWFLYALIVFSKKTIQNASTNSMKGMISKGKLEEVKLIHPPIELQRKFEEIFDKQITSVNRLNESFFHTSKMFNSLSQKAFTGKL